MFNQKAWYEIYILIQVEILLRYLCSEITNKVDVVIESS